MVISMLVIGGIFFVIFIFVEWKVSTLPMMPSKYTYFRGTISAVVIDVANIA
jgi:hypothetical protein